MMTRVTEAIFWDGVYATLNMYVVLPEECRAIDNIKIIMCSIFESAKPVKVFFLDDYFSVLGGRKVFVCEVCMEKIPEDLGELIIFSLTRSIENGAECVWFGFDGSFDYDHFLSDDVANQIYAIFWKYGSPMVALDDSVLLGDEWRKVISKARENLVNTKG